MCYGMGCANEQPGTGTCPDPRHCLVTEEEQREAQRERRIYSLPQTLYLCPECDESGKYGRLRRDGLRYLCPRCGHEYNGAELLDAYQGMHAGLVSDAEWFADRILELMEPTLGRTA